MTGFLTGGPVWCFHYTLVETFQKFTEGQPANQQKFMRTQGPLMCIASESQTIWSNLTEDSYHKVHASCDVSKSVRNTVHPSLLFIRHTQTQIMVQWKKLAWPDKSHHVYVSITCLDKKWYEDALYQDIVLLGNLLYSPSFHVSDIYHLPKHLPKH